MKTSTLSDKYGKEIVTVYTERIFDNTLIHIISPSCEIGPEELAMLQALYSRSYATILNHLSEVIEKGADKFMGTYYLSYGHRSIGDLGHITICFENVSMLAAKAIQDSQLYSGQEASTRYIDFSTQPFISFCENEYATNHPVQEKFREFYKDSLPQIIEHLKKQYPYEDQDQKQFSQSTYDRAIKARSFDIIRGFLPAGASTSLSLYTSLSHASEHLSWLKHHPLYEVRRISNALHTMLCEVFKSSFNDKINEEREQYKSDFMTDEYYLDDFYSPNHMNVSDNFSIDDFSYRRYIVDRPQGQQLPYQIGEKFNFACFDNLDFASFRDLQRHRAIVQRQGLLTDKIGFHEWYIDNLPDDLKEKAISLLETRFDIPSECYVEEAQYFLPMGYRVPVRLFGSMAKVVYLVELRCQSTVHPTLHNLAYKMAEHIRNYLSVKYSSDVPLYINPDIGEFSMKRGNQTILKNGQELK